MPAYYKVEATLNSQAVSVGLPSPQSVRVTLPLVGPQGPAGPPGEQGPPGEVSGSLAWDNVTDKPTTFPPEAHTHQASEITDFTAAVEAVSPPADWDTLANKPSTFPPDTHASAHATAGSDPLTPADIGAVADTDARLSDSRTPTSHASSHLPEGADEIFDQSLNTDDDVNFASVETGETRIDASGLSWDGALILDLETRTFKNPEQVDAIAFGGEAVGIGLPIEFVGEDAESDIAATRNNLGLGDSATADIGTTTGTVAAGDDSRFSDIPDPSAATPQPLGTAAAGTSDDYSRGDHIHAAPALDDLSNVSAATPSDNDVLTFDTATSTWVAEAAAAGASGTKTYAVFTPDNNQPTATAFATLDTRNSIAVLDFDDAATESAVFVGILPEAADVSSGLIVSLRWMATTATSGDVRWSVAWEKSNTDLDSDSFDTATAATATADGTSGIVTVTNITCTNIDSLAAGDLFRLRVQRVGGDGADTMTGDAELVAVEVRSAA
jgi:hypothetical protein